MGFQAVTCIFIFQQLHWIWHLLQDSQARSLSSPHVTERRTRRKKKDGCQSNTLSPRHANWTRNLSWQQWTVTWTRAECSTRGADVRRMAHNDNTGDASVSYDSRHGCRAECKATGACYRWQRDMRLFSCWACWSSLGTFFFFFAWTEHHPTPLPQTHQVLSDPTVLRTLRELDRLTTGSYKVLRWRIFLSEWYISLLKCVRIA